MARRRNHVTSFSFKSGARGVLLLAFVLGPANGTLAAATSATKVKAWLDGYEVAWESRDADRAAALFSTDATYHEMPFDAPLAGRDKIRAYWAKVTADQRDI